MTWGLFAAYALVATGDWVAVTFTYRASSNSRARKLEYILKPLAMVFLIVAVSTSASSHGAGYGESDLRRWWIDGGLGLSLVGDVFLMLPNKMFKSGLASFLAAHVAYIAGLTRGGSGVARLAIASALLALVFSPIARKIIGRVRQDDGPALLAAVSIYMVALATMAGAGITSRSSLEAAGGIVFLVSDATLAWDRFVRPIHYGRVGVMVTYHVAQGLLAGSLFVH